MKNALQFQHKSLFILASFGCKLRLKPQLDHKPNFLPSGEGFWFLQLRENMTRVIPGKEFSFWALKLCRVIVAFLMS